MDSISDSQRAHAHNVREYSRLKDIWKFQTLRSMRHILQIITVGEKTFVGC